MGAIAGFFRRISYKLKMVLMRFMQGRYGTDKLNSLILWAGLIVCLVSMFFPIGWTNLALATLSYVFLGIALFRCFSRNTYKRYEENRRFIFWLERMKDREHRYYKCPKCHQSVRVPKGKGKIAISCPKCREKFVKKT